MPSGPCCGFHLLHQRFLSSHPPQHLSRPCLAFRNGSGLCKKPRAVQSAWDSLGKEHGSGRCAASRAPSDGLVTFLGQLARQKTTAFPTGKRKNNNKGDFPLNMVEETSEAKPSPELNDEKGGFMQPGGWIPLGLLRLSPWDPPETAAVIPISVSWAQPK